MFRVVIPYIVVSMFIILVVDLTIEYINGPNWILIGVEVILVLLFPVGLLLAWNYEMSPDGFIHVISENAKTNPYKPSKKKPMTSTFAILFWVLLIILILMFSNLL